jgi:hypothetical protein
MKKTILLFCGMITILSCAQSQKYNSNPQGYDLAKPVKYEMPSHLLEISGIAFNNGDNSLIYAEQDEAGKLFYFKPGDKNIRSTKFGAKGDYEDVTIWNNWVIMLRSDGVLYTFPLNAIQNPEVSPVKAWEGLLPGGEYESLYADASGKLYLICKNCAEDKHTPATSGFVLQLAADGTITSSGKFSVDVAQAEKGKKKKKNDFRPSALAKNPLTGQWYILSSVNKLLVVTDASWKVVNTYPLSSQFLQPEGIAFDKQGNLYISNEGDKVTNGNILMFKYSGK